VANNGAGRAVRDDPDVPTAPAATALAAFGFLLALWPILVVHLAYAISVAEAHVLLCNPYWDGCTSISRAARQGWANHLFRAALLPYTLGLGLYWWLNQKWLQSLGSIGSRPMLLSGWLGVLFMVLYVTFLGTEGATYQLMRRYGINVYFGGTFAAELLLIGRLRALARAGPMPWPSWLVPTLVVVAGSVLAMGLLYLAADRGLPLDRDRMQNTMEWSAALLMQLVMVLVAVAWRSSGLRLQASSPGSSRQALSLPVRGPES
jgi:hypothetical protein